MRLSLSFHGAVGTVTGSRHLLHANGSEWLVDSGMFQGLKALRLRNWDKPHFNPRSLNGVLLTHAHLDHVGYLPRLVKNGFRGPVYCSTGTAELAHLILLDAARIQEEDAGWANKKGFSKHSPALPLFTQDDAEEAIALLSPVSYGERLDLAGDLEVRFLNNGHLLGSSMIEVRAADRDGERTVLFSGDLGRYDVPLHVDPQPRPPCDVLVVESTYGNRLHERVSFEDQIREPILRTFDRGGVVVIPAFAVGRTQLVTLILRGMMKSGALPDLPIHIDSPMAVEATLIYSRHLRDHTLEDGLGDGKGRLFPKNVFFHRTADESKKLNDLSGPCVIISASGMLTAGRILHHLAQRAPDPRNLVLLVGFQAEGTRGRQLTDSASMMKIHGDEVPLRCAHIAVHGLSGHGDADEMMRWVNSAPPPSAVFVVHGEPDSASAFANRLRSELGCATFVPAMEEHHDLVALTPAVPRAAAVSAVPGPNRDTEAEIGLRAEDVHSTIVVFGGTKIREPSAAREFARLVSAATHQRDFVVVTGGGQLGKFHSMKHARALVAFPGGYGTLAEIFEALCRVQTKVVAPLPIVLVGERFWRSAFNAEFLAAEGTIEPEHVALFSYAETPEGIWKTIVDWYTARGASVVPGESGVAVR